MLDGIKPAVGLVIAPMTGVAARMFGAGAATDGDYCEMPAADFPR